MIRNFLFLITLISFTTIFLTSCDDDDTYQSKMEDERSERQEYLRKNGITNDNLEDEGYYFQELYVPADTTEDTRVKIGRDAVIYYTGYHLNGLVFDSNSLAGKFEPMTVRIVNTYTAQIIRQGISVGPVIQGWTPALLKMHKGMKARIVLPSNLAYGSYGSQGIPPYTSLVFDIEVVKVRKVK